jgi:hypothetical protein
VNIPLLLKCPNCGEPRTQRVHLNDPTADFICEKCNSSCTGIPSLDVSIGVLILARSSHELEVEKDYDMAIVLAATALECELSRLYFKWQELESTLEEPFDPSKSEQELRNMGSIADKITKVTAFLRQGGIESFVAASDQWKAAIQEGLPSLHLGSLATDFQRAVFWPRNAVLHQGKTGHPKNEAAICYSVALAGVQILKEMDKAKLSASGL